MRGPGACASSNRERSNALALSCTQQLRLIVEVFRHDDNHKSINTVEVLMQDQLSFSMFQNLIYSSYLKYTYIIF